MALKATGNPTVALGAGTAAIGIVDTELPAAAAMADGQAAVNVPRVGAVLLGTYGPGNTEYRLGISALNADANSAAAILNALTVFSVNHLYEPSGANYERQRPNYEGTLLASSARTATTNSPDQTNYNSKGVLIILNVTSEAATETLSLKLQAKDVISSNYSDIATFGVIYTSASEAPTRTKGGLLYPGIITADLVGVAAGIDGVIGKAGALPRTWRAVVTHSASGSWTYSLAYSLIL